MIYWSIKNEYVIFQPVFRLAASSVLSIKIYCFIIFRIGTDRETDRQDQEEREEELATKHGPDGPHLN